MAFERKKEPLKLRDVPSTQIQQDSLFDERRFLALMLKDKTLLENTLASGITHEFFINHDLGLTFRRIAEYYNKYGAILLPETYESALKKQVSMEEVTKRMEIFYQILGQQVDANDFEYLRQSICDRHLHRFGYTISQKYLDIFLNAKDGQGKLVRDFQQEVAEISLPSDPSRVRVRCLADALNDGLEEIRDRSKHPEKYEGIKTGFDVIDKSFLGFQRGNYIVIAGVPNGGKTTLMFNLSRRIAKQKFNTVYVTVEADVETCTRRFFSIQASIAYQAIMRGGDKIDGLNDTRLKEFERAHAAMMQEIAPYFHWVEIPYKTPWSLIRTRLQQLMSTTKIDVLFVDYLNCIGRETSHPGRPDLELADVSSQIQNFGKANKILTFTAQQMKTDKIRELNKDPSKSKDFHTAIGDMSGTKEIESDADTIFAVWIDQETKTHMYLRSTKARFNKNQEKFTLGYDGESGRVYDLPPVSAFGEVSEKMETSDAFKQTITAKAIETIQDTSQVTLWGDPVDSDQSNQPIP